MFNVNVDVTSKDRPTMEQLTKVMRIGHIDIATKWHELGLELVDSHNTLKQIEANHRNDVSACCRVMLEKWLERTPEADWDQLVAALNEIDMKYAADFISRQMKSGNERTVATVSSCILMYLSVHEIC